MTVKEHTQNWHRRRTQESYREIFVNAKEYIRANYRNSRISLDDFCQNFGCSRRSAQRSFSFHGTTWRKFLLATRMQQACNMLRNTSFTDKAIAAAVGYSDTPQFRQRFKEHCGITPHEYREQSR